MKIKYLLPLLLFAIVLSGCNKKTDTAAGTTKTGNSVKVLVNELPFVDRPFSVLVPHSTNRLFTFVSIGANKAKEATVDLEYQSGDLLKGAKASLGSPISNPFVKAIILGSCSTGGKCTFDKDLKAGTLKFKLAFDGQNVAHLLKGDFTFVLGQKNLPDGKVSFEPAKSSLKENLILMNSFGLPKALGKDIVLYPVVMSAVNDKQVSGVLTLSNSGGSSAMIYNGTDYQEIKSTVKDGVMKIDINLKPWSMTSEIVRDDEKGSKENINLYLIGPIVVLK